MGNKRIDVSIIIISWKMYKLLETCLRSLYNYTNGINYELIIIDNNSCDGTSEMIKEKYPDVILITNSFNKGVAPARNQGMQLSKGKYILILDADMEFVENSVLKLYKFMELNPKCGMVGSKLIDSYGAIQYSCKRFPTLFSFIFRRLEKFPLIAGSKILRYHTMQDWDHSSIRFVDYLIGACQFIRSEVVKKIGYYDSNIFYGPEDIDYCIRIWRAGWQIAYYPETKIIHHEQRITKRKALSVISIKHLWGIIYLYKKYNGKIKI
jgi:N-acetylglucosaminyl-diphospho-decaprenol L-rhamnosyltransferase